MIIVLVSALTIARAADRIYVQVNNVSPYANPVETYRYYMLPFCAPKQLFAADQTFGQTLSGDRKMTSLYNFTMEGNMTRVVACEKTMSESDVSIFKDVIRQNYTAEFYIGDFRLHDTIGRVEDGRVILKTHLQFCMYLSDDGLDVLHINMTSPQHDDFTDISFDPTQIQFSFSTLVYRVKDRSSLANGDGIELEGLSDIQWTPLLWKAVIIILMMLTICSIMRRALNRDFQRVPDFEDQTIDIGWKMVRVEAMMVPRNRMILAALIGAGMQFLMVAATEIALGWLGLYYGHKGTIKTTGLITYAFTGFFNGFYSGQYYKFLGGKKWALSIVITVALFPGSMVMTWLVINNLAWYFDSTAAIPFRALIFIAFLWGVVYLPLTVVGGISGRLRTVDQIPGSDAKRFGKPIPQLNGVHNPLVQFMLVGFISFWCTIIPSIISSVAFEVSQIFQSAWGHYNFHLYSMLIITLAQTVIVVSCLSILTTYHQLNSQDYRWWWNSFLNSGATGVFLFLYSCYYLLGSQMSGIIQISFFLGYSFLSSAVVGLMLGTIGFMASFRFVFYLYGQSKGE